MQSDQFDKKVREAADHHHPPYDEKAWEKMEKLLNKHLPQKKGDRRRYIFFLLLFLLTGGGLFLIIDKPWQSNKPILSERKNNQDIPVHSNKHPVNGNVERINNKENINITKSPIADEIVKPESDEQKNIFYSNTNSQTKKVGEQSLRNYPFTARKKNAIVNPVKDNEVFPENNKMEINSDAAINKKDVSVESIDIVKATDETTKMKDPVDQKLKPEATKDSTEKNIKQEMVVKKPKLKNKTSNSFFLSASIGPDLSFIGMEDLGKTKLLAGAGIGYTFKNKFTLRTGFYSARKIYSAQPYQYHSGSQWYGNYKLERVDADCKIYEIPVLLSYHFGHSTKQSWFATTGVSSFLMKKEIYDYQYKNSSGQTYTHRWTFKDQNKHYFSVLTLSGGYQRKINNTFSIIAEPYMKIPLNGVGAGKVKLNSAGVLVSVGVKLFGSDKGNK